MGKRLFGCLAMSLVLAGCASTEEKPDVALQELVIMFPGHYDNTAQVESDIARGVHPPHEALALDIVPIDAIMIADKDVFYVQESIAGDPKRVLGQKIVVFGVVKKEVVQTDFALAEPHRWRNGQNNPDLFKGMMTQDVHSTKGCSIRWKRSEGKFVGTNDPKTCHARAGGLGAITQVESRAELGPVEYATAELAYDKSGHLAMGRQDEPFYRFRKQSHDDE
jgi:CpeT/CpcT family (DUF1001)